MTAGIEHLLWPELLKATIPITRSKGNYSLPLAEFVVASAFYFLRKFPDYIEQKKQKLWKQNVTQSLVGKTMSIIGYGDIGTQCGRLGKAVGLKIIAVKRTNTPAQYADEVYTQEKIQEVAARSDFFVCILPATPLTEKIISREIINSLPPQCIFINIGRGKTVDEEALIEALKTKKIQGAALDVYAVEPLPQENELWNLDNVLLSPHCSDVLPTI